MSLELLGKALLAAVGENDVETEPKHWLDMGYLCHDSDEGQVTISYVTTCGSDADSPEADGWDVQISSGSDGWGLAEHGSAVRDAIKLHKALGRDIKYRE